MALVAVIVVLAVSGGFLLGRSIWWSMRPTPSFPLLAEKPDTTLRGTVAYVKPFPDDECVWVAAASGGATRKVACFDSPAGGLAWLPDGRLQSTRYKGGEGTADTRSWIIDLRTGKVENVPTAQIPPQKAAPIEVRGPNGEVVTTDSKRGRLTMALTTDRGTRELLSVGAPDTYTFDQPTWAPDGAWFVVKDDLDRLLLVTTAEPSRTRVLVKGGYGQAVTADEFPRSGS